MKKVGLVCWMAILACAASVPIAAQPRRMEPIQVSGKKALVIGNDRYLANSLVNPPRDARSMDAVLRETGFTVTTKFNLSQREMEQTVDTFAASLHAGELALVYYSGHGMQIEGENYLNPIDLEVRDETDAKYGSYSVSRLREKLEKSGSKLRILILDACRDNPFRRGTRGGPVGLGGVQGAATGTFIAYATGDNSVADDNASGANGLFTSHLVTALREPGLTLDEVFEQVKEGVYVESRQRQSPYTYSNVIGRFYFRPGGVAPGPTSSVEGTVATREDPVHAYYRAHAAEFEEVHAKHILIRCHGSNVPIRAGQRDLSDDEALAKINQIRGKIIGGVRFEAMALEESDDRSSGEQGGDLGSFRRGQMVPDFENAAFSTDAGTLSGPVRSIFGYHLILVESHKVLAFEQVRAEIELKVKAGAR